jgi:hypothetical protein
MRSVELSGSSIITKTRQYIYQFRTDLSRQLDFKTANISLRMILLMTDYEAVATVPQDLIQWKSVANVTCLFCELQNSKKKIKCLLVCKLKWGVMPRSQNCTAWRICRWKSAVL